VQGSDVTDRVRAEKRQQLLINELNHRVKNTLASIQSIVSQTLRGVATKEQASGAITDRIIALSNAHNVLTAENWDSADLRAIVESSVKPFEIPEKDAVRLSGPDIRIGPHAAISIALALHELGTNAVTFGALSAQDGTVDVGWEVGDDRFSLTWRESGGPLVEVPQRKGFGSRLILRVLPRELSGTTDIDYRSTGVVFTLKTDLSSIRDTPAADGVL